VNKLFFIFSFLILTSCSTSLTIKTSKCSPSLVLFPKSFNSQDFNNIKITSKGVGDVEFYLHHELQENGLDCTKMKELYYSVETDFLDLAFGFLPTFSSHTISIWYR